MGTEVTAARAIPAPTPQIARSLSPQQLQEHRTQIGREVKIVLSAYFQPSEDEAIRAGQLAWWCDALQDWKLEQVVWALRDWNEKNPRSRPTPGDIVAILKAMRGRAEAKRMREAAPPEKQVERRKVSKEEAEAILREAGFSVRRFGGKDDTAC